MASCFQSGSAGSKRMWPPARMPVETVTMTFLARTSPLGVVRRGALPDQSMAATWVSRVTGIPAPWRATSAP